MAYNSLRKADNLACPHLVSLDLSHNRITLVDECFKLARCTQLQKFWFNDNPLAQRTSHRIRCLTILRNVKEMDGRSVTESDLAQVKMVLEQGSGVSITPSAGVQPQQRNAKVNNVMLAPPLPALQPGPAGKRSLTRPQQRFPR